MKTKTIAPSRVKIGTIVRDAAGTWATVRQRAELRGRSVVAGVPNTVHEYWFWLDNETKLEVLATDRIEVPTNNRDH